MAEEQVEVPDLDMQPRETLEPVVENGDNPAIPAGNEDKAVTGEDVGAPETNDEALAGNEEEDKDHDIDLEGKPEDEIPEVDGEGEGEDDGEGNAMAAGVESGVDADARLKSGSERDGSDLLSRPPHGSEVFIGGVTRDTTEEDLKELCSSIGEIYEVRIMKDKESGSNKGYGFVTFTTKENADRAIATLSDSEIKGKKVRVSHSQPKHRLFVGNVPKHWEKEDMQKALEAEGPGVTVIELLKDPKIPGRNRGFAFVEYYNHACAEHSRRNMTKPNFKLGGNAPTISWADPRPEPDAAAMATVKVVYVKGLPEDATEEQLKDIFEKHGEVTKVLLPAPKPGQPKRDFGFVHYAERSSALKAIDKAERHELSGKSLEVSLAKPLVEKRPSYTSEHAYSSSHRSGSYQAPYPQRSSYERGGSHGSRYEERSSGSGSGREYGSSSSHGHSSRSSYDRGYSAPAPVIYGRGPAPAGMTMVPMMLPDGRVGYVFQPTGSSAGGSSGFGSYRDGGRSGSGSRSGGPSYSSGGQGAPARRYRPY